MQKGNQLGIDVVSLPTQKEKKNAVEEVLKNDNYVDIIRKPIKKDGRISIGRRVGGKEALVIILENGEEENGE